jgi:prolyl 4-hydroxylase
MPLPAYNLIGRCQACAKIARFTQGRGPVKPACGRARASCTKGFSREAKTVFTPLRRKIITWCRESLPSHRADLIVSVMTDSTDSIAARLAAHTGMQRVPTPKAELFQCRRFVPADLCAALIALTDQDRRPSTIADDNGDPVFRTSETCDLSADLPAVKQIEALLTQLCGIDPAYGEPLQGQRYAEGQEFKPHTDYFAPDGRDFQKFCTLSGNRTWTFMIYLNDVSAGGATRFKLLDKTFQPEAGKLLCWNNRLPDAGVNHATLHHGMKVRRGVKYVITKWYREKVWQG